jgi:hypothetical protein
MISTGQTMEFSQIIELLSDYTQKYSNQDFDVYMQSDDFGYEVIIGTLKKGVIIRDGYVDGKARSNKKPTITSFDMIFLIDGQSFLNYVSDYDLSEYGERLQEVFSLIDSFYADDYTITKERRFLLGTRPKIYLNIPKSGNTHHFLRTH